MVALYWDNVRPSVLGWAAAGSQCRSVTCALTETALYGYDAGQAIFLTEANLMQVAVVEVADNVHSFTAVKDS